MYEVLIVDDEPLARESLKYLLDWSRYGFEVAEEAEDGEQALELMKRRHFSLVLTDIRMPRMNGLELIGNLRPFSDAQVVIVSGYEDFEYAKQGMKLGVNDYLLKPVDEDDLIELLGRIEASLAERELHRRRHNLGLSALRDQFLRRLAHGQASRREAEEQSRFLNLKEEAGSYGGLLVEPDFLHKDNDELTERDIELKSFAVRNVLEELCGDNGYVFEESEGRYGVVLLGAGAQDEFAVPAFARAIARAIEANVKETVSIGLGGRFVPSLAAVGDVFQLAEKALDGKFLSGNNSILSVPTPSDREGEGDSLLRALQDDVLESLRSLQEGRVKEAIARLGEAFGGAGVPENRIRAIILDMLVAMLQLVKACGADPESLFHYGLGDYERVMGMKTACELTAFAEKKGMDVLALLMRMKDMQPHSVIGTVKQIVQEQFRGNVSLRSVARQVYLNPGYLGKLFKAKTGQSFNEYLLQVRMEKAKQLLLQTDLKVYEIAQEVGYGELDWFYKRFKAHVGVSAGDFRSRLGL